MIEKPIPIPGDWIQRTIHGETAILSVGSVDLVKEQIEVRRFERYDGLAPVFGRRTNLNFETWRERRYSLRDAPINPNDLPATLNREQAIEALAGVGYPESCAEMVDNARAELESGIQDGAATKILRRYLGEDDGAKSANVVEGPASADTTPAAAAQPPIAEIVAAVEALHAQVSAMHGDMSRCVLPTTVLAEIAGLRAGFDRLQAEIAGLRGDLRAAIPQLPLLFKAA